MRLVLGLPWRRFRREPIVLLLIVGATFSIMNGGDAQDETRLALSVSVLTRGSLNIDPYRKTIDRSFRAGHYYTNKAPGMSIYALPVAAAVVGVDALRGQHGHRIWEGEKHLWLLRLLLNGPLLMALCLVIGRVAEGLVPGTGALAAVVAGLGTLLGPLSTVLFEHVGAALLAFGAFCLAWRRRHVLAGVVAGAAVLFAYEAAIIVAAIGAYVLLRGLRPLASYALGVLPGAVVLGVYNALAFGSPFHLSYRYQAGSLFHAAVASGFFGFTAPSPSDIRAVLVGGSGLHLGSGLLVTSPVLIATTLGLGLLWRRGARSEAALCALVGAAFLVFDAGNIYPYGGTSPGPRYLAPALPFVLLGLAPALERMRRTTLVLAVVSVVVTTILAVMWMKNDGLNFGALPDTVWAHVGIGAAGGVAVTGVLAALALAVALAPVGPLAVLLQRRTWTRTAPSEP
jgi:hypothetical protein